MNQDTISRRRFVQHATVVGAGLTLAANAGRAIAATAVHTVDRSGLRNPVTGAGAHTYEVHHDWVMPPKGISWGDTHGACQDASGRVYIAHTVHSTSTGADAVVVFDQRGKFIESWGADFRGGAHGLDLRTESGEEFLYHCDTRRRLVVKTNLKGEQLWQAGCPTDSGVYADPNKWCPTNVAFSPDGDIFVGDGYGSSYIHRYSSDGQWKSIVARPGSGPGEVACPHGLWVDDRGPVPLLCVADRSNARLQYLTLDGAHAGFVTDGIRKPCHMKLRNGDMLIPDLDSVVTVVDSRNKVLAHLGDGHPTNLRGAPRDKFIEGRFIHPHDAIWLAGGDILVAEWVPIGRVTRLVRKDA